MLGVPWYVVGAAALVVGALPLLAWSVSGSRWGPSASASGQGIVYDERQAYLKVAATDRLFIPVVRALGRRVRRVTPRGWVDALDRRIRLAGSPAAWTLERALALKVGLGAACAIAGFAGMRAELPARIALTTLAWAVGYAVPDLVLHVRGRKRQETIVRELPDTLDQLTISVEAGLGFDAALSRVAASGTGPLAEELMRVLSEIKVGVPRTESLKRLLGRTDVQELRHFVLALQQAEQFGLPVARVLRIQSSELRLKRRQRAEETAMKIPVKIVFPLVFCIFPALFVVLLGPAMIRVARALL
jgi:tight adherence protein C